MTWLPWVTGFTMPVITQILFLWRRKEIVIYLQKSSDLWETHKHDSRYHVDRVGGGQTLRYDSLSRVMSHFPAIRFSFFRIKGFKVSYINECTTYDVVFVL